MNNILGVDLKIDQNYIAECVKEVVNASMIEALGAKNDIVETIVKELLNTKVDKNTGKPSTSSWKTERLLDFELRKQMTEVVKETVKQSIEEKKPMLTEMIKKELNKKSNMEKFVDSFINNTTKTLENSWSTKINIDFEKKVED